jgi:hypothetical protein
VAERRYSQEQRDAVASAFSQPKVSAKRVAAMAAAGELTDSAGEPLEAFTIPLSTVRDLAREARLGSARASKLADAPHGHAIEALRQRTIRMADAELAAIESQPDGKRDLERFRQAIRVVADAAKIPVPTNPRPTSEAIGDDNGDGGPDTTGGPAGALIAEHRRTATAHDQPTAPAPPELEPPTLAREEDPLAELRADIERVREQQRQGEPKVDVVAPQPVRNGERPRRGRRPEEDTSSWR